MSSPGMQRTGGAAPGRAGAGAAARQARLSGAAGLVAIAGWVALASACTGDIRSSTTARTAEEQLLVSTAAERALARIDAKPLAGRALFIDWAMYESYDRGYVLSAFRELCAKVGARLVDRVGEADIVVEVRASALANTDEHHVIWVPLLYIQGLPPQRPDFIEIGYVRHRGWGRIQAFAYERATGAYVFGWRDGWGRAHKAFFDDIYPPATVLESLGERVQ